MITEIKLPQLSVNEETAMLNEWLVQDKSFVESGQEICYVQISKAIIVIEAGRAGFIRIGIEAGQEAEVGSVLGWITDTAEEEIPVNKVSDTRPKGASVTDKARKLAVSYGIKLEDIQKKGIIREKDVMDYLAREKMIESGFRQKDASGLPIEPSLIGKRQGLSQVQKIVCRKVVGSFQSNVSAYLSVDVEVAGAMNALENLVKKNKIVIRLNELIIKFTAEALKEFPLFNAFYWQDEIVYYKPVNVAVIMDNNGELVLCVIADADKKTIEEIARESSLFQMKIMRNNLSPQDCQNATFTVTNLGSFGVTHFMPVINSYQSAILGVSSITKKITQDKAGFVTKDILPLEITYDHRIINGIQAAKFINFIKERIESFK